MKFYFIVLFYALGTVLLWAEAPDHHAHEGKIQLTVNYENLVFKHSKQKDDGKRYGVELDYQNSAHHFQVYSEHTDTHTKKHIAKDLSVNKVALKYQYSFKPKHKLSLSYMNINDNLMKEVDDGDIYGLGYAWKSFSFTQYFSDYKHFNVYQSDVKWGIKKAYDTFIFKGAVIGKYIYIQDRLSNNFSKKTQREYFTVGAKLHVTYDTWHFAAVGYTGERIFAVMNEGLRVQHHAMAFDKSMMLSVGKEFESLFVSLRYIKQHATEVPIENDGVEVSNISLNLTYTF